MPAVDTQDVFMRLAMMLALTTTVGVVATMLRQPLIVAFIAVGIMVGPTWLDLLGEAELWDLLATTGISILLFVVGLKLDLEVVRETGPVALLTGLGQVAFTSAVGFVIALLLGMSATHALYVAVALTFSSTIIIVKLLSDKREIDSLHGRVAVGFLIVQDIVVVLVMIGLSAFGAGTGEESPLAEAALVLARGAVLIGGVAVLMRWAIPPLFRQMAKSQELLVLAAIAWAVTLAAFGDSLGFSKEVGAFLAGFSLASTPFREAISSRLVSLRDFLLLFFFLTLGASLDLSVIGGQVWAALIFSAFVLIGNPIIVMAIMGYMGYRRRTGFLAGLTVAQISEFSLILGALGVSLGHIDEETMGLITLVGLITIGLSTYLILYSHQIYALISGPLRVFEREIPHREEHEDHELRVADAVVFGLGRYGGRLADGLRERGMRVLGVDFDPQVVHVHSQHGEAVRYGDAEDQEFLLSLPLARANLVISSVPQLDVNIALARGLQDAGFRGKLAMTAHSDEDGDALAAAGVHIVLRPFTDAADRAAEMLGDAARAGRPASHSTAG